MINCMLISFIFLSVCACLFLGVARTNVRGEEIEFNVFNEMPVFPTGRAFVAYWV